MQELDYIAARSSSEVISLLSREGERARILSGGTDLIVQLREGRREARLLVDIKRVPDANRLVYDPVTGLMLGAAVPCHQIVSNAMVARLYPGLLDAISLIGGTQIQGRASVGGNLCNASPAADSIPALIVHRAICLVSGPGGGREIPVEDFCIAPGRTVLATGEFLEALRLPPPPSGFGASYLRFIPRNEMDIAVAGAGVSVVLDEARATFVSARVGPQRGRAGPSLCARSRRVACRPAGYGRYDRGRCGHCTGRGAPHHRYARHGCPAAAPGRRAHAEGAGSSRPACKDGGVIGEMPPGVLGSDVR